MARMFNRRSAATGLTALLVMSVATTGQQPPGWTAWRGPFGTGMAHGDAPVRWTETDNVAWKVPIPGRGHSTPVVAGDQIFLTTAIPTGLGSSATAR